LPGNWSQVEVEAIAADYFDMLGHELRREPYNKTAHRNALAEKLENRSGGSIERKHQNISAILISIGYPYIDGYKPLGNYQRLLEEVVVDRILTDQSLSSTVRAAVSEPATVPFAEDILAAEEPPPEAAPFTYAGVQESLGKKKQLPPVNYLEREARNRSLGRAGEEWVIRFERSRLIKLGAEKLADQIDHVAVTYGDGLGFDIRSFEHTGEERLIEVKTTAYGKQTPFFVSKNEVGVSKTAADNYHLMRVFKFRETPRLYSLKGSLEDVCWLNAVQFAARPK
jgi:hypothetical protein